MLAFIDAHPIVFTVCFALSIIAILAAWDIYCERRYGSDDPA